MTIERRDERTTAPPGLRGIDLQPGYDSSDKVLEIFGGSSSLTGGLL